MPNSEFFLDINDDSYKITLDRAREECIVPGNVITAHLKIQKGNYPTSPPSKSLIESVVRDCLQTLLDKGAPFPYVYFATKTIAITNFEVRLYIDFYGVSL